MLPRDPLLAAVGVGISSLNLVAIQWLGRWRADRNRAIEQIRARLLAGVMWAIQIDRERQGRRFRVRPARPLERRPGPHDQRRASAGVLGYALARPPPCSGEPDGGRGARPGRSRSRLRRPEHRRAGGVSVAAGQFQPAVPRSGAARHRRPGASRRPRPHRRRSQPADRPGLHGAEPVAVLAAHGGGSETIARPGRDG